MNVKELIAELSKYPDDMVVCSASNGYDSDSCPAVYKVKLETMIYFSGDYHPASNFPAKNIKEYLREKVVLLV